MKSKNVLTLTVSSIIFLAACSQLPPGNVSQATLVSKKGVMQECTFYHDGKPVAKMFYDGKGAHTKTEGAIPDGLVKHLFSDGKVNMELHYQNNMKNGPYKLFNREGKMMAEGNFREDQLEGENKSYNAQGLLTVIRNYKAGVLHGPSQWLYEDGSVKVEKNYQAGKEHGEFIWRDKDGKIKAKEKYKNGWKIK